MSFFPQVVPMVRQMIADADCTTVYSDTELKQKILTASNLMQLDIEFDVNYTIDMVGLTITPDPSSDSTFIRFAALKTACMIERSDVTKLTGGDVQQISDNDFTIKTGDIGANKIKAVQVNWCSEYNKAVDNYIAGELSAVNAKAIVSPFAYGAYGAGYDSRRG